MSGHSKWSKIKRQKEAGDQKRGQLFTKLGRAITVAAKQGGGDTDSNFALRLAVSKAKSSNMPKDNIERAIKRGTGEGGAANYEELIYEGFGPEKISVVIEVLTDNKNRAVSELKHLLSKSGGSLASQGSVMWQFDKRGLIMSEIKNLSEEQENTIIESGAIDFVLSEDGLEIITEPDNLEKVKNFLEDNNFEILSSELSYIPKETKKVTNTEAWEKFIDKLNDLEDVNEFYSNTTE